MSVVLLRKSVEFVCLNEASAPKLPRMILDTLIASGLGSTDVSLQSGKRIFIAAVKHPAPQSQASGSGSKSCVLIVPEVKLLVAPISRIDNSFSLEASIWKHVLIVAVRFPKSLKRFS